MNTSTREPSVVLASQSVAGEEDPGASIELAIPPRTEAAPGPVAATTSDQPAGGEGAQAFAPSAPMRPGDEAPEGTAGTGENVCPSCGGSGQLQGTDCAECAGTGKVTVGVGGA